MPQIWLKRALIPLWVIENVFIIFMLVLAGIALEVSGSMGWVYYENGITKKHINNTGPGLVVAFSAVSIGLNIFEVVQFSRCRLSPVQELASATANGILWAIMIIVGFTTLSFGDVMYPFIAIAPFAVSVGKVVYASVMLSRQRKGLLGTGFEEDSLKTGSLMSSMIETPGKRSSLTLSDAQRSQKSDPFRSFRR